MNHGRSRALLACCALCLLLFALHPGAQAARNPFLPSGDRQDQERRSETQTAAPSLLPATLLQTAVQWQLTLRNHMTRLARDIAATPWGRSFWLLMLASGAYGAAHALGPGHGKAFAVAWFMERPASPLAALLFGNLSMFCHVLSAALLVFGGTYVLETTASGLVNDVGAVLEGVSYALLAGLGLLLLGARLLKLRRRTSAAAAASPATSGTGKQRHKGLVFTALAAGLAPCPGAALVLLFCLSLGLPLVGLLALLSISLGMGAVISLFALATLASRSLLLRGGGGWRNGKLLPLLHTACSLAGGLLMAGLGGLLFWGWWLGR